MVLLGQEGTFNRYFETFQAIKDIMEVNARVIQVLEPTKYVSRKTSTEQYIYSFVVETINEQYPKKMYMQVFGSDKWTQFNIQVGKEYSLRFDVGSREYNGRWFTELTCFSAYAITANGQAPTQAAPKPQPKPQTATQAPTQPNMPASAPAPTSDDDDSHPF